MSTDVPKVKLLIAGRQVESRTKEWREVVNPATQQVVARVPFATREELEQAVAAAKEASRGWRDAPVPARMRVLLRLQQLVREKTDALAALVTTEHGKTLPDAVGEVGRALEAIEYACSITARQLGDMGENAGSGIDVYTLLQPLGVGAGITAFNFPVMLPSFMFPIAIACGNTFLLKPSEQDPSSAMLLAQLAHEAGLPPGVLNVVHGGAELAAAICDHPEIKAVSFIGSTGVGRQIYQRASNAGKRAQCMMGAKNHCVIMPDANRDQALNAFVGAAFGAAGQRCMATPVGVFVGEARAWIPEFLERARRLKIGPGTDATADLGPLVSKAARARVERLIQSGLDQGARLLLDGRGAAVPGYPDGNFVGPTVFTGFRADMDIYAQEIFGPVALITDVPDLDAAIRFVNANPNGNGVGIFTQSGHAARKFQNEIDVGQVGINLPIPVPVAYFSFTGSRGSKLGDLGPNGRQAVTFWTQTKSVMARWFPPSDGGGGVNTTITMK